MRRFAIILSVLFVVCAFFFPYSVESVSGKFWTQKEYKDFDDGTPKMAAAVNFEIINLPLGEEVFPVLSIFDTAAGLFFYQCKCVDSFSG